ncbi:MULTISPECIES: ROK family transcriptional regulator [unclassified Aureimonas]|uniref:ROK family transcriptional regulator n=1 Tax=unclassified Aureimonas TaxID=2615206 RepID=UPI0006F4B8CD|nr:MULTISPECIES: ROK family transcriptional regulator [unclassified Aureimonas]KQT52312.1 hypothetical protein ASG62_16810 [Aureimonas sp. Leaf427]KQT61802.1 hypothetical protein ASG54_23535 [Aureimonas sp. Leaf460]
MRFAPPNPLRIADRASGLNAPSVRSYNERLVLSLLLQNESTTRLEIGQKTGLSAQTISVIVRSLEQESLVAKGEAQRGRMGPPTIPMILNPEGAFSVGVSFGTRGADVVVIDFVGNIRFHKAHRYEDIEGEHDTPLKAPIDEAIRSVDHAMRGRIAGIGLAVPDESLVGPGIRKTLGHDLADAQAGLEIALGLPVFMQNDVTAAAGGESLFGVARQLSDFVFFYLGSRLQCRLVLNHQIHNGSVAPDAVGGLLDLADAMKRPNSPSNDEAAMSAWRARCRDRIVDSVSALLGFVGVQSLVLSTNAPAGTADPLLREITAALSHMTVLPGKISTAPKAWGAASLPYHSRFMVQ